MDKEQAIETLRANYPDACFEQLREAVDVAIEALKAQLSQEGTTFSLNNQVNLCDSCTYIYPECPSEKVDVIFGNGLGNDNICACNKYQPTVQPVDTDTISRQAAIDALQKCRKHCIDPFDSYHIDIQDAENQLSKLPPAQPEPSIPLSWIERHIELLKSFDNEYAKLAAADIFVMVERWRSEHNESD